ncbi:hypothetical protein K439DRAFT_1115807 [Ramaria rubella]|nr:hypothetical protein K439DRAFT_1115807 [Ramaria rubella]
MALDAFQLVLFQENSLATVYEHLLTLARELDLIWPTSWNVGKFLFFATRYLPLVDSTILLYQHTAPPSTSPVLCALLFQLSGALIVIGMVIAELVLVFRTWAVWGAGLAHVQFGPSPYPNLQTCWITKNPHGVLYVDYVVVAVFDYSNLDYIERETILRLVVTLYRDGIQYYFYLIGFSLVNIIILAVMPSPQPSLILMQRVLHSICTTRILLNLREAASQDHAKGVANEESDSVLGGQWQSNGGASVALSSIVFGVDIWFAERDVFREGTAHDMV